jgi:hypothetical protein
LNPSVFFLRSIGADTNQDELTGLPVNDLDGIAEEMKQPMSGIHKMVGWKDDDRGIGRKKFEIRERKKDPRAGVAVSGLHEYGTSRIVFHLRECECLVVPRYDRDCLFLVSKLIGAFQGMLKQRPFSDK